MAESINGDCGTEDPMGRETFAAERSRQTDALLNFGVANGTPPSDLLGVLTFREALEQKDGLPMAMNIAKLLGWKNNDCA